MLLNLTVLAEYAMRAQGEEMKCPKCGRLDLRETPQGVTCRVCGYTLTPGENDRYRLYKMLKEEENRSKRK
jgi:ribosomal protein L37AE/L43A